MPRLRPGIYLKFDGTDASEQVMDALVSVEVDDSLTLPDMFAIHLRDPNMEWIDADTFSVGNTVEISARPGDSEVKILSGEITAIEPRLNRDQGGSTLILRGYDKSHRLNRGKKSKTFLNTKDSDIASSIASKYGLGSKVDSTRQVHDHVYQDNMTDWEFLISRAQRVGFCVFVKDGKLHFVQTPSGENPPSLEWNEDLIEFNARLTASRQVSKVVVQGWDPNKQQQIVGQATQANDTPQIGENQQGGQVAQQVFGDAEEIIVDRPVTTQAEADALAQSICDEIGQGFVQAECVCLGNPAIQAGALVELKELGNRFSGKYRITHALHRFDASGYKNEFTVGARYASTISELLSTIPNGSDQRGLMLGVVTNVDDPDDHGRVKAKIPSLKNDEETAWARMVAPGAGSERGIQWLPEVNDEVLVAFEHGDINRPLIIGGLWSDKNKLPLPNSECIGGGVVNQRIIQSRSGHVIILDDSDGAEMIKVCDKTGKNEIVVDSASNSMTVKADKDITIEAKGKINVKSSNGDLSLEGNNLEITTKQNFTVQATGSCSIKSTQNCTVEGTAGLTMKNAAGAQIAMSGPSVNVNNGALEVT